MGRDLQVETLLSTHLSSQHSFIDWSRLLFTRRQKEFFFFSLSLSPDDDFAPAGLTLFHRESVNWKSGTKTTKRVQKYCWEFLNGSQLFWLSFPSTASAPFAHLSYLLSRSLIVITPSENDFLSLPRHSCCRGKRYRCRNITTPLDLIFFPLVRIFYFQQRFQAFYLIGLNRMYRLGI